MRDFLYLSKDRSYDLKGRPFEFDGSLKTFLETYALAYGSTLSGRIGAFKALTGIRVIPPLIISHRFNRYYLVTRSLKAKDVALINYDRLFRYVSKGDMMTELLFDNGFHIVVPYDYRIIKRQIRILREYLRLFKEKTYDDEENLL